MDYCARCLYPANARPTIILDDEGVCSGCRYHESRHSVDWDHRGKMLKELLEIYKAKARENGQIYDCLIPVSGGKDSHFQVHLMKDVYGMNPLCVAYNHTFNTSLGLRNLNNLVKQFNVDLIRFTANPGSVRKIAQYMIRKIGDITWHYHAGIMTFPFQVAVKYRIPLLIWGEEGFSELTGMFTINDIVEFTKWKRQEHDMRGLEPENLVADTQSGIRWTDVAPYVYPKDEEIEEVGCRGIYLSNFINWDAKAQAELMISKYGFATYPGRRERTFNVFAKTDDHANDVHDYLKYLKFGYGRATDDASHEIRHGRMTREEGIEMVRQYDATRPSTLDGYLKYLGMSEEEFESGIERMRDPAIWEKASNGRWQVKDSVMNHVNDPKVEAARLPQSPDRTLSARNRQLYYLEGVPLRPTESSLDEDAFVIQ